MLPASAGNTLVLGEIFQRGRNSFSVLRLLLASAVILSHSYYLPGYGVDPLERWSGLRLGGLAVDGFFALSGMLVTASLCRNPSILNFIRHRLARLMPGFWVCLAFCAFLLAPVVIAVDKGWSELATVATVKSLFGYVLKNSTLLIVEPTLPNVLSTLSYQRINPCLWTLAPEACCYALLAVAGVLHFLHGMRRWLLVFVFVAGLLFVSGLGPDLAGASGDASIVRLVELGLHFLGGGLTVLFLGRLRLSVTIALCLTTLYLLCLFVQPLQFLRILLLAPALAAIGRVIPLHGRCDTMDISYGLYLYGSALQQFLVWSQLVGTGAWSFFVLSLLATVPLAFLSWTVIEKPALTRWGRQRLTKSEALAGA